MKQTDFGVQMTSFFTMYLPTRRDLSDNTISSYRDTFKLLLSFSESVNGIPADKLKLKDFTEPFVSNFINWLAESRGNSAATQKQRLAAIHVFVNYLKTRVPDYLLEYQRILDIRVIMHRQPDVGHFTASQVESILAAPDVSDPYERRDMVLMSLMYDSAARVQEICDLTVKDLRLRKPYAVSITGKGDKTAVVPLMKETAEVVKKYLSDTKLDRPEKCDSPLFTNHRGEKLTRAGVTYILKKYCNKVRKSDPSFPKKVSPHMLRHSKAMHMLQAGIALSYIRDFLRHSHITTTQVYAKADVEMRRTIIEESAPKVVPDLPDWRNDASLMAMLNNIK
ncbi:MAG: site-specific integrase [Lachnospiraceae bacterium]|nr:site-specific integrase [Lachnospiraceae bacterium]